MRIGVFMFAALVASTCAIYADERGKNEWSIENFGEINDAILINSQLSYILSVDGVLTHFDSLAQRTLWRRQLPQNGEETFTLRNVGRNILALSNERAILINSAGQNVYEVPLEGSGRAVAEIF